MSPWDENNVLITVRYTTDGSLVSTTQLKRKKYKKINKNKKGNK
jgi:hypothetical protein